MQLGKQVDCTVCFHPASLDIHDTLIATER